MAWTAFRTIVSAFSSLGAGLGFGFWATQTNAARRRREVTEISLLSRDRLIVEQEEKSLKYMRPDSTLF
jgi:hypothetical protein